MTEVLRPVVASVALLATRARQEELLPWLRVVGEPVSYVVEAVEPHRLAECGDESWDVILVDGASFADAERMAAFRYVSQHPRRLATSLLLEGEGRSTDPGLWTHDVVRLTRGDWGERLRARVQTVALAPWRRSLALRMTADSRGLARLQLVPSHNDGSAPSDS